MDLTPLRVRGKKGNKANAVLHNTRPSHGSRLSPPSLSSIVTSSGSLANSKPRARKHTDKNSILSQSLKNVKGQRLSRLEELPNELLHRIFLLAANLDLPAVSPYLTRALNGPGADYLKLECSIRALTPRYVQIAEESDIFRRSDTGESDTNGEGLYRVPAIVGVQSTSHQRGSSASETSEQLLNYTQLQEKLSGNHTRTEYQHPSFQHRLVSSQFFTKDFYIRLAGRGWEVVSQKIKASIATISEQIKEPAPTYTPWPPSPEIETIKKMESCSEISKCIDICVVWLEFSRGTKLPDKCTRGPWLHGRDVLLCWLVRAQCGLMDFKEPGSDDGATSRGQRMLPLPTTMLADAIKYNEPWIVYTCAIRARTVPTTEMLRQALATEPFPFSIVQNLLLRTRLDRHSDQIHTPGLITHLHIDTLDPQVWSFIEHQERREAERAKILTPQSKVKVCISVSKWLRHQLDAVEDPPPSRPRAYSPEDGLLKSLKVDFSGTSRSWKLLEDVPPNSELQKVLIELDTEH